MDQIPSCVEELARELAFFRSWRYLGLRHIKTCGYGEFDSECHPKGCSPRCEAVCKALENAALVLSCTVEDFYLKPKKRKEKAA